MRTFDLDQFWPLETTPEPRIVSKAREARASAWAPKLEAGEQSVAERIPDNVALDGPQRPPAQLDGVSATYMPPAFGSKDAHLAEAVSRVAASRPAQTPRNVGAYVGLGFGTVVVALLGIGLWTFISNAVVNPAQPERTALVRSVRSLPVSVVRPAAAASPIETGSITPSAQAIFNLDPMLCRALVLDRASGNTYVEPCPADARPMRDAGRQRRGDLAALQRNIDPRAWAAGTAINTAEPSQDTLLPSDVTLEITAPKP